MESKAVLFKMMLAVKAGDADAEDFDIVRNFEDLAGAKEEYNETCRGESMIFLLNPHRKRLNLLLLVKSNCDEHEPETECLRELGRILKEEYDFCDGADEENSDIFEVKTAREIKPEECRALLEEMQDKHHKYFNRADHEVLLTEWGVPGEQEGRKQLPRRKAEDRLVRKTDMSLKEALAELECLAGAEEFRAEMAKVLKLHGDLQKVGKEGDIKKSFPCHYIFTAERDDFGYSTILKIMSSILYHLNIIDEPLYYNVENCHGPFRHFNDEINGVIALNFENKHTEHIFMERDPENLPELQDLLVEKASDSVVVCFVPQNKSEVREKISDLMDKTAIPRRCVSFSEFTDNELMEICRRRLGELGYTVTKDRERELQEALNLIKDSEGLKNNHAVDSLINNILVTSLDNPPEYITDENRENRLVGGLELPEQIKIKEKKSTSEGDPPEDNEPYMQLQNMAGLAPVKERVNEIISHFVIEKRKAEAGIKESGLCMHMRFAGNPGTGKTTVARIIGRILKEKGILSKGELKEVSREGLVGAYVGHTALKTKKAMDRARGGILFIDEAYSLQCESLIDYGHEAVSTLVKYMEDYRDDLLVILAGYPKEMETMMNMNPGLNERVPHKIDFPDYTADELLVIFRYLLGEKYHLADDAEIMVRDILQKARVSSKERFSNGRFVRNLVERLMSKQSNRLYGMDKTGEKDLLTILPEDVARVYDDEDIACNLRTNTKEIGFAPRQ